MRKKNKNWVSAGEALKKTAKRLGLAKKIGQYGVFNHWEQIAGPLISKHAVPSRWQGNTLVLTVEHASWMQELSYLKTDLMRKIKEILPDISMSELRFEVGKIPKVLKTQTPAPREKDLSQDEEEFIEQAVKEMKDEASRSTVRHVMMKYFQCKKE